MGAIQTLFSGDDAKTTLAAIQAIPGALIDRPLELAALWGIEYAHLKLQDSLPEGETRNMAQVWVSLGSGVKARAQFILNNQTKV
jgi:hypothetical protein